MSDAPAPGPRITRGACHAVYAYDLGFSIDLDHADRLLRPVVTVSPHRAGLKLTRRAPRYFAYQPPPLCLERPTKAIRIGPFESAPAVEAVVYDFGVASVTYTIPIAGPLEGLRPFAEAIYENEALLEDSRRLVAELLATIRGAVVKPDLAPMVEDYMIYRVEAFEGEADPVAVIDRRRGEIARILRSEAGELSAQEVDDAVGVRVSYSPRDAVVIDWNAALVVGVDAEDSRAVLEFANVELLELRFLDNQLDRAMAGAYEAVQRRRGLGDLLSHRAAADLRRISTFQVDSALLFEGVNNSLKLLGDQYLARLYRLAAQRLHLPEWDTSILRKLGTLETIYDKIADRRTTRRMEALEWIIIFLIAFEVVMSFLR
jgi:hypothetical protein